MYRACAEVEKNSGTEEHHGHENFDKVSGALFSTLTLFNFVTDTVKFITVFTADGVSND